MPIAWFGSRECATVAHIQISARQIALGHPDPRLDQSAHLHRPQEYVETGAFPRTLGD